MSDYISREEVIKECIRYANHEHNVQFKPDVSERRKHNSDVAMYMCEYFKKFAEKLLSADVRENVHGEWILQYRDCGVEFYSCNKCNKGRAVIDGSFYKDLSEFPLCPNCGADMRGEAE